MRHLTMWCNSYGFTQQISVGECFGTFTCIDGTVMHKEMLMVTTQEPNCEFMKITTSDYSRVIEVSKNRLPHLSISDTM